MKKPLPKTNPSDERKASRNGLRLIVGGPISNFEAENASEPKIQKIFRSNLAACLDAMADDLNEQIETLSKF